MPPGASRVSPVSPRILTPETSSGRRRTPGVSAPLPLVWLCTAAPVLGFFCSRGQGLEKRLRLDYRRLARQPRGAPAEVQQRQPDSPTHRRVGAKARAKAAIAPAQASLLGIWAVDNHQGGAPMHGALTTVQVEVIAQPELAPPSMTGR